MLVSLKKSNPEPMPELPVQHLPEKQRFEIHQSGQVAVLEYNLQAGVIAFTHTGVPPALEGQGIGSQLARAGLEFAREQQLKVRPFCWFIAGYIERHPEYQDLL